MEGLAPFLFFILLIIFNIMAGSARKKKRQQQQQQNQPEQAEQPQQPVEIQQSQQPQQPPSEPTRPLDYTMSKPKNEQQTVEAPQPQPEPVQTIVIDTPNQYQEIPVDKEDLSWQVQDKYKSYLERTRLKQDEQIDNPDVIRDNEISDKTSKININIEKQQIMQAITYAQVLEQPKSLQYLKRFGIKRVVHKD